LDHLSLINNASKDSMKKLWLLSLTALLHTAVLLPMSFQEWDAFKRKKAETETIIANSVSNALAAFDLTSSDIEISTDHITMLFDKWPKWGATSSSAYINARLASNPHLLEFASYCAAAKIKNANYTKTICSSIAPFLTLPFASAFLSGHIVRSVAASYTSAESQMCLEVLAVVGGISAAVYGMAHLNLPDRIGNYFDRQAFALACQKLVTQKKIEAMSAYLAYLSSNDHQPLSHDEKFNIMHHALENAQCSFKVEKFETDRRTTATILDPPNNKKISSSILWKRTAKEESYELQTKIEQFHKKRNK